MNVNQLLSLLVFLGLVAVTLHVVFWVIPGLARQRMIVEVSKRRTALRQLCEDEPIVADHPDVQRLDEMMAAFLHRGGAPGIFFLLAAWVTVRRHVKETGQPPISLRFLGLTSGDRIALYSLSHAFALETLRASILGSRFWIVTWMAWVPLNQRILETQHHTRDAPDDRELGQVLAVGSTRAATGFLLNV